MAYKSRRLSKKNRKLKGNRAIRDLSLGEAPTIPRVTPDEAFWLSKVDDNGPPTMISPGADIQHVEVTGPTPTAPSSSEPESRLDKGSSARALWPMMMLMMASAGLRAASPRGRR